MLRSLSSVNALRQPLKALETMTATCVACRTSRRKPYVLKHIRSIPEETKGVSQLDDIDLSQLQPQYRHIKALENAPEPVRRIFTLKFGTTGEKMESKYLEYAEKLQTHKHDHESLEMQIVQLTLRIRNLQERRTTMNYEPKVMRKSLENMVKERNDLLLHLRFKNFSKYCLTMKVLDLNLIFWPEYNFRSTSRERNIADMRTRSFAEIQRIKAEKERRALKVATLQTDILQKIKSGEIVPTEEFL